MLRGRYPPPCFMSNRLADPVDDEFIAQWLVPALQAGVAILWPFAGTRPRLCAPLFVTSSASGKKRPVYDARLLNLFLAYRPFHYETLRDLVAPLAARNTDYISTRDQRSGYHHVHMQLAAWDAARVQLSRPAVRVQRAAVRPVAGPVRIHTPARRGVQVPRSLDWQLTAMIDDAAQVHSQHAAARWQVACCVALEVALGILHSWTSASSGWCCAHSSSAC